MSSISYVLFDDKARINFLPLTWTRPVCDLRIGMLTIREKWDRFLGVECSVLTSDWIQSKYPLELTSDQILINGRLLPDAEVVRAIKGLKMGEAMMWRDVVLAVRLNEDKTRRFSLGELNFVGPQYDGKTFCLTQLTDLFRQNARELENDFELLTANANSEKLSKTNVVRGEHPVFVSRGASAEYAIFNTTQGPIWLGAQSEIMEGAMLRGPLGIGDHSVVKMGAKIYGGTTIGPYSKVGGEINNSIFTSHSNKAHDGYLGNSVIGQWCNLGADTNNSNLRNDYDEVSLWSYESQSFRPSGSQFCGLIMGDHSKTGINTMFNTGTVVGVSANIFGGGFQPRMIPDFSWGGQRQLFTTYRIEKALQVAERVLERRGMVLDETERTILQAVFERSAYLRTYLEAGKPGEINLRHKEQNP